MLNVDERNFFTAGEMAGLFGISKQALLYYDKIKLLSPDFVGENGYRYYSIEKYLDLEIIVNMRLLNISIADIKYYLEHRNKENFLAQLRKKAAECSRIIKENERIYQSLQTISSAIATHTDLPLNQLTVCSRKERQLRLTELTAADNGKERVAKFARHAQLIAHQRGLVGKQAGWIIDRQNFFAMRNINSAKAYFSFSDNPGGHAQTPKVTLPSGLYVEIYFIGTFYDQARQLVQKISRFLQINEFVPCSDIYLLPIENHWFSETVDDYINLLFVQVQNAASPGGGQT